jgi:hypothetical protein
LIDVSIGINVATCKFLEGINIKIKMTASNHQGSGFADAKILA